MYRNVRKPDPSNKIQKYFLILYQGLKSQHFYWEFVNSARKISILIAFLLPKKYQIMFSLVILLTTWRVQAYLRPYKNNDFNEIEMLGVNVGIITLCSGMVYNSSETNGTLDSLILVLMLFSNFFFLVKWTYLMIISLSDKYEFFSTLVNLIQRYCLGRKDILKDQEPKPKKKRKRAFQVKKGRRTKKGKTKRQNYMKKDVTKTFLVQKIRSSMKRGEISGSDQRMVNNLSMDKYNQQPERRSSEIDSRIIEKNPESDQSRLDYILHAIQKEGKHQKEAQRDEMSISQDPNNIPFPSSQKIPKITYESKEKDRTHKDVRFTDKNPEKVDDSQKTPIKKLFKFHSSTKNAEQRENQKNRKFRKNKTKEMI